jgi:thiol-disulfide isomerase/thioredoxin
VNKVDEQMELDDDNGEQRDRIDAAPQDGDAQHDAPHGRPPAPVAPLASDSAVDESRPRLTRTGAWLAMAAVAGALLLVYLPAGMRQNGDDGQEEATEQKTEAALVGHNAPLHFTLKDMNGVEVKLASFKGKVILLNFWATWCPPCKVEIPDLVQLQAKYPDDLVVLGLSIDDTPEQLKPFAAEYRVNYPVLVGRNREDVQDAFGPMFGIPVSVLIDREGRISRRHAGIATKAQFEKEIQSLL